MKLPSYFGKHVRGSCEQCPSQLFSQNLEVYFCNPFILHFSIIAKSFLSLIWAPCSEITGPHKPILQDSAGSLHFQERNLSNVPQLHMSQTTPPSSPPPKFLHCGQISERRQEGYQYLFKRQKFSLLQSRDYLFY